MGAAETSALGEVVPAGDWPKLEGSGQSRGPARGKLLGWGGALITSSPTGEAGWGLTAV